MSARVELPKKFPDLVGALDQILGPAEEEVQVHRAGWAIIDGYLQGIRRFNVANRFTGAVSLAIDNPLGRVKFSYEKITSMFLAEVGRYLKMDFAPLVTKKGDSLGAMRKAGVGNALLQKQIQAIPLGDLRRRLIILHLKYGIAGIDHESVNDPDFPDRLNVIHPSELRSIPAWVEDIGFLQGVARKRWVPAEWFQKRIEGMTDKKLKSGWAELAKARWVPWGSSPPGQQSTTTDSSGSASEVSLDSSQIKHISPSERRGKLFVPLEEVYLYDEDTTYVADYTVKAGDLIGLRENFAEAGRRIVCPLQVIRHTDTGRFFSRGFVGPLIGFNDQMERSLQQLFTILEELDLYGTMMIPGDMGINLKQFRKGKRPRFATYNPDPNVPAKAPFALTPHTAGPFPSQILQIGVEQMEALGNQGPLLRGEMPGRTDSAAGAGFVFNTGNVGLALPANGIADGLSHIYERMLQAGKERFTPADRVEIAVIDDTIAGVKLDPVTGQMSLSENPIPDPWEVKVDIRDRTPLDKETEKQELLNLFGSQLVDEIQFWITNYEKDLGFPGAPPDIVESWRKVTYQIVILFGDGETPGEVALNKHTQNPEVQLRGVQQFMNKLEFGLASAAVQLKFEAWKELLEGFAGSGFPDQLPPLEDVVESGGLPNEGLGLQGGGPPGGGLPGGGVPEGPVGVPFGGP